MNTITRLRIIICLKQTKDIWAHQLKRQIKKNEIISLWFATFLRDPSELVPNFTSEFDVFSLLTRTQEQKEAGK